MKRARGLCICLAAVVLLAQCRAPWHVLDNPVDPDSPTYIGVPSVDNNGNGIPQYIDVEEMELISPADDAVCATVTPVLATYRFDPSLVKRYWIQIATENGFAPDLVYDEDALPGNAVTVPAGKLYNNTTYFWRAKAYDGTKWSTEWSETRVFSVHINLGVPGNPSPAVGADVGDATPELDWSDVAGADGYEVQVDDAEVMVAPYLFDDASLTDSVFLVTTPLVNGFYYWRARIKNDGQWGDWSPTWNFEIVTKPEINVKQGVSNVPDGGGYAFGSVLLGGSGGIVTFTIENQGTAFLDLDGTPKVAVGGPDAAMFVVNPQPASPIAPDGSSTFTITFTPSSVGAKTATVTIANKDADENPYDITLTGNGIAPEINVMQGITSVPDGTGSYPFGNVLLGTSSSIITLRIQNLGTADLHLDGAPKVAIGGSDAAMFVATIQPTSAIAPGGNSTFDIVFTPGSLGVKTATVTIENDDGDEDPYNFTLTGMGVAPEINVKQGATSIADGTGSWAFGNVVLGSNSGAINFTVENLGTSNLTLDGTPKVVISGADAAMFVVSVQPASPVAPAGSSTFTITFTPGNLGAKTATVTIANDDQNEDPYNFTLMGTGVAPEINAKQGATNIIDGTGTYAYGNVPVGVASGPVTFTVENLGTSDLTLDGTPKVAISGVDAAMFVVNTQPTSPITPAGSSTFTITFTPSTPGAKSAAVSIDNNDANEDPYNFTLTGTGVAPEINVMRGATGIADGTGSYAFGNVVLGVNSGAITFAVENLGTSNLNLDGTPKVAISGTDAAMFVVGTQPSTPIAPAGSSTFTITFTPGSLGAKTATVTIANDDQNEDPYNFAITGTGVAPEINVKQGTTNIADGTGSYVFGNVLLGSNSGAITFTVENLGTSNLNLDGTPKVAISGADAAMFVATIQPTSPLGPGGNSTFDIVFTPGDLGAKTATVTIENDDGNEDPYNFTLTGAGVTPEIHVKQGATSIADGTGSYTFGNVVLGSSSGAITITVENLGTGNLNLTGDPVVDIIGIDAAMFVVGTQPGSPIAPAGSSTFTITFTPGSLGAKTATVIITNNDSDENPYTFTLTGTGVTPEINVKQGAASIADGTGSYAFGNVLLGSNSGTITFTVENLGTADLNLDGTPKVAISGTDAAMFVVGTQPGSPIAPAGSSTFTITFTPGSLGAKTATVTIANDDQNEDPYNFAITGTGVAPEINVKQGTTNIADGTGSYVFGNVVLGSSSGAITFTVENLGTSNLNLDGTPKVAISGTDAAMFVVGTQPGSPIAPAGSSTFTITFTPGSLGAKTATVTIANDDGNEAPYDFTITGTGVTPEINVKQGATNIADGTGSYTFGNVVLGSNSGAITFTVENLGTSNLNLNGTPKVAISGADAAMFVVGTQPSTPIAPAGTSTFTITFTPGSLGAKTVTVTIGNDDGDEAPYDFTITGTGVTPEINVKQGATSIADGTGIYAYGTTRVGIADGPVTFTVENLGTSNLNLDGTPKVAISGTDAAMFVVGTQPASPVAPAGTSTFTITFTPGSLGAKTATVTIANDDQNEDPYNFTLTGTGVTPEINVKQGATNIADGTGNWAFGNVLLGSNSGTITFTVENLGTADLNLDGTPKVAISGTDAAMFVVGTQPASPVAPAGTSTFTITFTPGSLGAKTATVTIANDDQNEDPYNFAITGTGVAPEINVKQGTTNIADGTGSYVFGNVVLGSSSGAITFTVENLGTSNLNLDGTPKVAISGTDAAMFVVGTQPGSLIAPAGSSTFTITFTPGSLGAKTVTVTIENDDGDEAPYDFTITGTGVAPEINVKQGTTNIADGTGSYTFGNVVLGVNSGAITFTVENLGTSNLNLNGTPKVAISGTDAAMFVVGTQPGSPIAPAGTSTFTITFTPESLGAKTVTVTIENDDGNEAPYDFTITGTGVTPEINVKQGATNIADGTGIYAYGTTRVGIADGPVTFTVENLGTSNLNLDGTPKVAISGTDAAMFVVGTQPASPVAPAGTSTFTITFTPGSLGAKTATVTIANDDQNEDPYNFTLTGTGVTPEINVKQGATNIADGTGNWAFGNVLLGSNSGTITFTVENLGTADLNLDGTPKVAISGTDAAMFVVGTQPASPVAPAGTSTFTITFTPGSLGAKTATVTIANDDQNEDPYNFAITGTGVAPEINVKQGTTNIADGTGSYVFGNVVLGSSSGAITFTVENLGTSNLNLDGTPKVAISGTDAAMFVVGTQPGSLIAPAGSSTFTITFTPGSLGAKTVTVTIENDDGDEAPYDFTVTGTGVAPEINVKQGTTNIADGTGSYTFGNVVLGVNSGAITFTVENLGTSNLNLNGTPKVAISGTDAAMFVVGTQPSTPIAPAGTSTFTITFTPESLGAKTVTVTIENDDGNEAPYDFTITGTGVTPEINVKQGVTNIADGTGTWAFGNVLLGSNSGTITFTVENLGTADLNLDGTPKVAISGTDAAMFVVGTQPASPVAPAGTSTFTITFTPGSLGAKTATVTIANDDQNEDPYNFTLTGTGVTPEINVKQGATSIADGTGSYAFGNVLLGSNSGTITFTVENLGTADLNLDGTTKVAISGTDAAMFVVGTQPGSPIAPAGSSTFTITFTPGSLGVKTATVTIANDDQNEDPYNFTLTGTGVTPEINVKQGATNIADGTGSYAFGNVLLGSNSGTITFTVENLGTAGLNLDGTPKVAIGGTDAAMFVVGTQPSTPIAPAGSSTFTITFTPESLGAKTVTVTIENDDGDEAPYDFTITGTGVAPEINVMQGATGIPSGGSHDFGSVKASMSGDPVVFTVENLGTSNLNLDGTPKVAIGGSDAAMFTVTIQPTSPVNLSSSATFTIVFTPASAGMKNATLSIASDDADEDPYTIGLRGTGIVPDMNVKQGISNIPSGGSHDFGAVLSGTSGDPVSFAIENLGLAELILNGSPSVTISGLDASMFAVGTQPTSPIVPAGTSTFTITFSPTSPGVKTALATIENDDPDEDPYTFTLTGAGGAEPEINLFHGSTNLPSGGSFNFGDVAVGSSGSAMTFTVENLGTADLNLTGNPLVEIAGADVVMFTVDAQPSTSIGPSGNTTFTITFLPANGGVKTATVTIANDDSDENPYTFMLTGNGVAAPEIGLRQNATEISSGTGSYDFGIVAVGSSSAEITFTVENLGTADLELSGAPRVGVGGTNSTMFTVMTQPDTPVPPSGATVFMIMFSPGSLGAKRATISIVNNDANENPYTFEVRGRGT